MNYSGHIVVDNDTLLLYCNEKSFPKIWSIVSTTTLNKDGKDLTVYNVESWLDDIESERYYTWYHTCSMYQDDGQINITNHKVIDEGIIEDE